MVPSLIDERLTGHVTLVLVNVTRLHDDVQGVSSVNIGVMWEECKAAPCV